MNVARKFCWVVLFGGLSWIILVSAWYFDDPESSSLDPIQSNFFQSGDYLPPGNTLDRGKLGPPVHRLLEADRHDYRRICFVGLATGVAALGIALIPRRKK
jgi:hypothetical protein